jgi:hypothetical protein
MARERDTWVRLYRLGFGALELGTLIFLTIESSAKVDFVSFFTVQSNFIASMVLLTGAILVPKPTLRWDLVRGAAAMYMILTGVIYNTLLTGYTTWLQTTEPWANDVLHRIMPVVLFLDIIIVPMAHRIHWQQALVWVIYPLAYLAFALILGANTGWYPYPFVDPHLRGGYWGVTLKCTVILICFLAGCWVLTEINAWRLRHGENARLREAGAA